MEEKKIKIGSNRSFGIVFSIVFLIIALYPLLNSDGIRIWSIILSSTFFIFGVLNSNILSPLNRIWFKFGIILGRIVSPIVMGLVFFLVVTPTSLILRLFKKDNLNLKKNDNRTYWIDKSEKKSKMKDQF
ncbi:SxtJ family membrane protein [Candidatus Pelagibacter sp.]|nr:SxtJ family membrane protein [Candidatus Pelagibacter sp.]